MGLGLCGPFSLFLLAACGSSSPSPGGTAGASASGGSTSLAGSDNGGTPNEAGAGGKSTGVGGTPSDGGGAGGGSAGSGVCKHELTNAACWQTHKFSPYTDIQQAFFGAVFDGQYMHFVNGASGIKDVHLRFDTRTDFVTGNWSTFDTANDIDSGFRGGAFDGRYVYLTPTNPLHNGAAQQTYDAVVARFDTRAPFSSGTSWSSFNLTQASGTPDLTVPGFRGAAFDGRYVYFAPAAVGSLTSADDTPSGKVTRFDTQADFGTRASWSTFDLGTVAANATNFAGAIFDGHYLYFAPSAKENALAVRYDTQAEFSMSGSWVTFETTSLNQFAGGFDGGVFDGRYLYFVPHSGLNSSYHAVVTRYDTAGAFTTADSWSTFDTSAINPSQFSQWAFQGGAFDGRYLYLVPSNGAPLVRFDTKADFSSTAAWSSVRIGQVAPDSSSFSGAAFDGRYLYLVPNGLLSAARFDAGANGDLPAAAHGSFY